MMMMMTMMKIWVALYKPVWQHGSVDKRSGIAATTSQRRHTSLHLLSLTGPVRLPSQLLAPTHLVSRLVQYTSCQRLAHCL